MPEHPGGIPQGGAISADCIELDAARATVLVVIHDERVIAPPMA